ncbi:hypothetical protein KIN20_013430 [Parelaphostrongylus tenuis]|uniref:Uncharacterized protein n=1 Tax=Parelaphostrongylus tenuis TaxID=148309 RepID=A0AAD5MDK0_PARTN|nr:hypothetical protein KIN20_013428 [Parelaphostrongylus tenuis]KAJ1355867.1 hypothetical protein KIN20_013430 [Parelaphostrongylus tenuis]
MRAKQVNIRKELPNRMTAFDLRALVADVQYVKIRRKQILELAEELARTSV